MPSTLAADLLAVLDRLSGRVHPGFRPAHARGTTYAGTFTPNPAASGSHATEWTGTAPVTKG
ncbi:MAG TPA: hypothetical protein VKE74_36155 [Gemmataceae bacterium]|nr:hypothetical protein [Gemmataceae bacterium]